MATLPVSPVSSQGVRPSLTLSALVYHAHVSSVATSRRLEHVLLEQVAEARLLEDGGARLLDEPQ